MEKTEKEKTKTLSLKIISRFLKGGDLENFLKNYHSNKLGAGNPSSRTYYLAQPLTPDDLALLKFYCLDTEKSIADFAKERGIHYTSIYAKALRVALRFIAQHPAMLKELTDEEEKEPGS